MQYTKDEKILQEIQDNLKKAKEDSDDNYRLMLEDLEFVGVDGAQWPEDIKAQRISDGRPCLTINKMSSFIDQVVGDQRMNRPSIKVIPVDDKGDIEIARIFSGWIKHVQAISKADIAIDHGFEHAVTCGYGAMRVVTKYIDDSSFNQDAYIEKVDNALAIYWGKHLEYDCSDAKYCVIITKMDRDAYKTKYGHEPMEFGSGNSEYVNDWCDSETVLLAEYFVKTPTKKTLYELEDGEVVDKLEPGVKPIRKREVDSYDIMWYKVSGDKILERSKWVGKKYIPIVPIWGKELNIGGKRYIKGLIRNAKDSQRMYNYWSALSLDTLIPTPEGWITMKELQVGYQVFGDDGKVCNVTNVSPVYQDRPCYEVLFDDGSVITADETHLWTVEERGKRKSAGYDWKVKTITTKELIPNEHFIWNTKPLELPEQFYTIPPYVLGVWLGDGTSREPNITQSVEDAPFLWTHLERFGCVIGENMTPGESTENRTLLGIRHNFVKLNLLNNKHIPYEYVRGSVQQRLELLQGLMDTDGSVNSINGSCDFTTTSKAIAAGVSELLNSLGIKAKFVVRERGRREIIGRFCDTKTVYQFYFTTRLPVFRLCRKFNKLGSVKEENRRTGRYSIVSVTPVQSVPVKCITVDNESSLYLAGPSMIPTHNSVDTEVVTLQPKTPYFATPDQLSGHEAQWNTANQKNWPYLLVNPDPKAPGWPQRQTPPQASSAMVERIQSTDQEMRDTVGLQKASLGIQSNERSGKAIIERKKEGDTGTFSFIDNLSRSVEQLGRILVDIAPGILDTDRIVRLGLVDGKQEFVGINKEVIIAGETKLLNDTSVGQYDVVVTVGPSFTTQRTEARQSMAEFIQYYPQAAPLIGDLYAKNMDWPGAEEVSERLEFLLPPEVKKAKAFKEAKQNGEPPPTPEPPPQPNPEEVLKLEQAKLKLQDNEIKLEETKLKLKEKEMDLAEAEIKLEQERIKLLQERAKLAEIQQSKEMKGIDFIEGKAKEMREEAERSNIDQPPEPQA